MPGISILAIHVFPGNFFNLHYKISELLEHIVRSLEPFAILNMDMDFVSKASDHDGSRACV